MEGQVIVQMCLIAVVVGEMYTQKQSTVLVCLDCGGINQFRPHMKPGLFVLCYLLLQ